MKRMISLLLIAILAVSCFAVPAMADSHPPMYRVTDAEGHTIYLFGTMHVVSKDTFPITGLDTMLKNVDRVYFEVGEADMEKLANPELLSQAEAGMGEPELVAENGISEETADLLEQFFRNYLGMENVNRAALHQLPVSYLTQLIQSAVMGSVQDQLSPVGVDVYVFGQAKELGLKILGVEDLAGQLEIIKNDTQVALTEGADGAEAAANEEKQLARMLSTIDEAPAQLAAMCIAYSEGDTEVIAKMMEDGESRATSDAGRNEKFLEAALQALKDGGNAMFAIGVYHLIAEDGLVNTLTEAGCTVEKF